jgi:hypothetical protein
LWDEQGNFYFLDTSTVDEEIENYKSHTWVLYKRASDNSMRKTFLAQLNPRSQPGDLPAHWAIDIPDLNHANLDLQVSNAITHQNNLGIVTGTVTSGVDRAAVSGFFSYSRYK